jgi:hypothetical protein
MNCQDCQRYLLSCERFDSRPPDVAGHLAECLACGQWQKRLLQIESHVPSLPLPLSSGKEAFLQSFLEGGPLLPPALARIWSRRQRITLATGLAAAILLVACAVMLIQGLSRRDPQRPLLAKGPRITDKTLAGKLLELNLRLAEDDSPRRRVETLAKVADNLQGESRALAKVAGPKDLDALARLYTMVVRDGIVARARNIPADQLREALDPIAEQLSRTRREAEDLARKAPDAAEPLRVIAAAARSSDLDLRDLMKEATP